MIATNCCDVLKGLSLEDLELYESDMKRFVNLFHNLEILELFDCSGDQKYIEEFLLGHQYPNLTTLKLQMSDFETEILTTFFLIKREVKTLELTGIENIIEKQLLFLSYTSRTK